MERGVWGERLKKSFHFKYIKNLTKIFQGFKNLERLKTKPILIEYNIKNKLNHFFFNFPINF
jgi:hypothetical protein